MTAADSLPASAHGPQQLARAPVFAAMVSLAAVLTAVSGRYGYHRDELYFRMLEPAWGYVDQPPLAPYLARLFSQHVADEAWALRLPATAACVLSLYVLVLITRELGGGRAAQTLCAWGYGFASLPLIMGHALLTSTLDLAVWPAVVLFAIRAQLRGQPGWWLAAGVVGGVSLYNKLLLAVLLAAVAAGVAAVGPRHLFRCRWVYAGAAAVVIVGLPNLLYQAANDWPQLSIGRALEAENGNEVRIMEFPFLLLILGPPLVPIWVAGLRALWTRAAWRPIRFLAAAFPVLLVLVFAMGAQFYYPFGLLAVLFAAGCVPAEDWAAGRRLRRRLLVAAVALNAAVSVVLGLPVVPIASLGATPVPDVNQVARDTVGWPEYVRQIGTVFDGIPSAERAQSVVITSNYGEAGAVHKYGPDHGLPAVYSGHNALWYRGGPPASTSAAVLVGGQLVRVREHFESCQVVTRLDNNEDVDTEEQQQPVAVCRGPAGGWSAIWPLFKHQG